MRTSTGLTCPTTPCTLQVDRKAEFVASFSKEGYESQDVMVQTRVAGSGAAGFAGNVLVGGIVGMGVDAATGATLEHYPNPVTVSLAPLAVSRKYRARKPAQVRGPVKEVAPTS
ncbi:translation initiation factor 2 [Microvirga sp. BSC39]|uniref:translation initiation factor 2 n=1 Tax=Microvirga sp. BSC39 TaxID=1549810 RepID=UPI001FCC4FFB|nr:translation initiation factor 2 [Microvirga sp. BSC39]